jgi:hypothetical protein
MRPRGLPYVEQVVGAGPDDPVFDSLLLAGPIVLALLAILGRHPAATGIAIGYLGTFVTYVLYLGYVE